MSLPRIPCPTCRARLAPERLPAKLQCPKCGTRIIVNEHGQIEQSKAVAVQSGVAVGSGASTMVPAAQPTNGFQAHPPSAMPVASFPSADESERQSSPAWALWGTLAGLGVFLLTGVIALILVLSGGGDDKAKPPDDNPLAGLDNKGSDENSKVDPNHHDEKEDLGEVPMVPEPPVLPPPEVVVNVNSKAPDSVDAAITRGVDYLKKATAGGKTGRIGITALAGLTLLACGVPPEDPSVTQLAKFVRSAVPSLRTTYDMSICVWFLDRLNYPADEPLIRTLALRLIAGQMPRGGWNYTCPALSAAQESHLLGMLQQQFQLLKAIDKKIDFLGNPPPPKEKAPVVAPVQPLTKKGKKVVETPIAFEDLPVFKYKPGQKLSTVASAGHEDNSLTQFAVLALFAAQKHNVPTHRSLALVDARFRQSQNPNGSWGYIFGAKTRMDSMTCAGLVALAVGRANQVQLDHHTGTKVDVPKDDPVINKALKFAATKVGTAPHPKAGKKGVGSIIGANSHGDYYYFWSLERVGVIYGIETIEGKDWYKWGAPIIVSQQKADGSWHEAFPGVTDTCLALLFLKRFNVAQDVTRILMLNPISSPK
jgi:predicted RNA-binding Zn-ribbon protein involved in translation (DUF1610 family)